MNKEVEEIKEHLDFAREVFDYTLNPNQCGLLLDYINQLETNRDEAYKLLDDIDEYMLVEQHLKLVEAKKLLERGKE